MSNPPLLMATQGCNNLKIMAIHIDTFILMDLNCICLWFEWLICCRILHLHLPSVRDEQIILLQSLCGLEWMGLHSRENGKPKIYQITFW